MKGPRSLLAAAAGRVLPRRRTVLLTYPGLRLGNILYLALQAHLRTARGRETLVLDPEEGAPWHQDFPGLTHLLLPASALRRTDARAPLPPTFFQRFGTDFHREQLERFILDALLPMHARTMPLPATNGDLDVVVNVRRGDYYAVPEFRERYGFDIVSYVQDSLDDLERESGPITNVTVVSDDDSWCKDHLQWRPDIVPIVSYLPSATGVVANFYTVASGRRLVLANSTFSYWAAYVSNVMRDNRDLVWAPDLHTRAVNEGKPWQHDPNWRQVPVRPD